MYRIYDEQKEEWRDETHEDKEMLLAEFREHWEIVNYDSEYEDIINSDLDEEASKEDVERQMKDLEQSLAKAIMLYIRLRKCDIKRENPL